MNTLSGPFKIPNVHPHQFKDISTITSTLKFFQTNEISNLKTLQILIDSDLYITYDPIKHKQLKDFLILFKILISISESKLQIIKVFETYQSTLQLIEQKRKSNTNEPTNG